MPPLKEHLNNGFAPLSYFISLESKATESFNKKMEEVKESAILGKIQSIYSVDHFAEIKLSRGGIKRPSWIESCIAPMAKAIEQRFPGLEAGVSRPLGEGDGVCVYLTNPDLSENEQRKLAIRVNFLREVDENGETQLSFRDSTIESNRYPFLDPIVRMDRSMTIDQIIERQAPGYAQDYMDAIGFSDESSPSMS